MPATARAAATSSLLQRLLRRPQQVWLRRAIFQVHLWAGLLLALYVIAIGISGSILVFKEELMPKPHPYVGRLNYDGCTAAMLTGAMDAADRASAGRGMKSYLASCPTPADPLFAVGVRSSAAFRLPDARRGASAGRGDRPLQRTVYVHPQTGAVLGEADRDESWVETVEQLHVNLLMGRGGRMGNGAGAAVLLLLTLSGLVLWWPGIRNWRRGLTVDVRRSWKRINFDLHSALGFWTLFFTLTWALTGIYFAWPKVFTGPIQKLSPIVSASYPAPQLKAAQRSYSAPDRPIDVASMISVAQQQSPGGRLEGVFFGTGQHPVFTVYMARGIMGDYSNTDFVYFDQRSGGLLYTWHRGVNRTVGDWLVWLIAPLHFGTSWGQGVKVLWALLGLALPALTITGILMYWNRWLSKRWMRQRIT